MPNVVDLRSPRIALSAALTVMLTGSVACISDSPAAKTDTADTSETFFVETTPDIDGSVTPETTPPETTPPETVEEVTQPDVEPEVVVSSCTVPADCTAPPPQCFTWVCPAGTCEAAPASGGTCDDGDLCTGLGMCAGGVCQPGSALTCDGATACGRPTCDPQIGCGVEPIDGGVCDAGNGVTWGTCDGVRMAPVDVCDDSVCVDQVTPANVPISSDVIEGDWFVASTWVHPTTANIMAGLATFDAGGKWGATFRTNTGSFTLDDQLGRRGWCLDANNGLSAQVSISDYTGQVNASGTVFTASGSVGDEVMVGIRPEGFGVDTTGTYQAMYITSNDAGTALRVSYAILVFSGGCLEDDAAFVGDAAREPVFVRSGGCMYAAPGRLTQMALELDDNEAEGTLTFLGALDANNDVGAFVLEDGPENLDIGMLTIVRLDGSARAAFTGASRWVYSYQAPNPVGVNNIGFPGALYFNGATLLNGTREGAVIYGDRVEFDEYGRFLLLLRATTDRTTLSGYIAPSLGFGFYYEVDAPDGWVTLDEVTERPKRSAWGFLVKRP